MSHAPEPQVLALRVVGRVEDGVFDGDLGHATSMPIPPNLTAAVAAYCTTGTCAMQLPEQCALGWDIG